jgi:uncharacterized cupin superfamily protein
VATGTSIEFSSRTVQLDPSPIRTDWILEGNPVANYRLLSTSADGRATTLFWECTAGRFNWFYDIDETVCLLEGSVTIKDETGTVHRMCAGDTIFFPAGSRAEWSVETYVRKVAFCRAPLPKAILVAQRIYRAVRRMVPTGSAPSAAPAMFQDSKAPPAR